MRIVLVAILTALTMILTWLALSTDPAVPVPPTRALPVAIVETQTPRIITRDRAVTVTPPSAGTLTAMAGTWEAIRLTPKPTRTPTSTATPPLGGNRDTEPDQP